MPGGDGTGPMGMGPMTGRAAGYCAGYTVPGYANPVPGGRFAGFGRGWFGRAGGRGWRNRYYATGLPFRGRSPYGGAPVGAYPYAMEPTAEEEMELLKEQSEALKQQLNEVQNRIDSLGKNSESEKDG